MTAPAVESIRRSFSELCVSDEHFSWENPRRFGGFCRRLQLVLKHFLRLSPEALPPSAQTALKGVAGELKKAADTVAVYRTRSRIFVLINCKSLCAELRERSNAIGGWLALLDTSLSELPDLRKKIADLSRDMNQAQFRVTESEDRVHCTLQEEGKGRQTSKAVQSAIIMDLARALGIEFDNQEQLSEEVKLLKNDLIRSNSVAERRILMSLEGILDNWSLEPDISTLQLDIDFEEDARVLPFRNFICPLTKQVMKEPVVLESAQTYERTAIEYWFERCIEDGRDPTCPVTGQVLKSLEQKPNIGLAGAIEEWMNRNIEIQIKLAVQHLSVDSPSVDCIERVLDSICKISEEHPSTRYMVRNAGVVALIVQLLRNRSKSIGTQVRSKALMALLSMAKDEESKKIMFEDGITRLATQSLMGISENERENAVKVLLEYSNCKEYCAKIASEKGALVLLSSMAGNLEFPALSNLAEEVLRRMEMVEDNVQHLVAAGRFGPLLSRLHEGTDDVKIEMASMLGRMTLSNCSKEQIARQSGKILIDLLYKPQGRISSLQALRNLSSLDDNATILVDSDVLPALSDILFANQEASLELKELAASIISDIVSKPGHWELAPVDKEGHTMQSELIVFDLLKLLSSASPLCQLSVLQILWGIASSPQASESVASHMKSGDGIKMVMLFLEHPEAEHRTFALRLARVLSERFGQDLANELKSSNNLPLLKNKLLDNQSTECERSDAACLLANLPLSEDEVKTLLGASFVRWIVATLQHHSSKGRPSQRTSSMLEGLLGLLHHFTKSTDRQTLRIVREYCLMTIFCEQLSFHSKPRVKQLAALGLKNLSGLRCALVSIGDYEQLPPQRFYASLVFKCWQASLKPSSCPIHNAPCEEDSQFCLLKSNCIKPLVDLLQDEDTNVQISAVEALSTLVYDTSNNLKRTVDELEKLGMVDAVISLFTEVHPGELQERLLWIIERILRVESNTQELSLNQSLVRALVEAFKHGNDNTRRHAQDALTNLKQLSGISGKALSQNHRDGGSC